VRPTTAPSSLDINGAQVNATWLFAIQISLRNNIYISAISASSLIAQILFKLGAHSKLSIYGNFSAVLASAFPLKVDSTEGETELSLSTDAPVEYKEDPNPRHSPDRQRENTKEPLIVTIHSEVTPSNLPPVQFML
jgi:hypothetical protein